MDPGFHIGFHLAGGSGLGSCSLRGLKTIHKCFAASRRGWLIICTCGAPVAGWFVRENPNQKERMDDLGVPPFMDPPIFCFKVPRLTESRVSRRVVNVPDNHPSWSNMLEDAGLTFEKRDLRWDILEDADLHSWLMISDDVMIEVNQ